MPGRIQIRSAVRKDVSGGEVGRGGDRSADRRLVGALGWLDRLDGVAEHRLDRAHSLDQGAHVRGIGGELVIAERRIVLVEREVFLDHARAQRDGGNAASMPAT